VGELTAKITAASLGDLGASLQKMLEDESVKLTTARGVLVSGGLENKVPQDTELAAATAAKESYLKAG
jgi:hypothetical protein